MLTIRKILVCPTGTNAMSVSAISVASVNVLDLCISLAGSLCPEVCAAKCTEAAACTASVALLNAIFSRNKLVHLQDCPPWQELVRVT